MRTLAALALFAASAAACTSSSTWDYLMLVIQWPPTECMPQNFDCSTDGHFFTIHGEQLQLAPFPPRPAPSPVGPPLFWVAAAIMLRWRRGVVSGPVVVPSRTSRFVEHHGIIVAGLWPNNFDGSYPCFCTNESFDPNAISSFLDVSLAPGPTKVVVPLDTLGSAGHAKVLAFVRQQQRR